MPDHRDIPDNRRGVGEEEAMVAVEHAQTPGRQHQQPRAGEENANQANRQLTRLALETRRDRVDDIRRGQDPGYDNQRSDPGEESRTALATCAASFSSSWASSFA